MAHALSEETRSETTSNSTSEDRHFLTKEERDEIATILGIPEEDVVQEKFRVSRRRMEQLMFGHTEDTPITFFDGIMSDTNTIISWPTKLKANATSRKDPYIKIQGRARNIMEARIRVVEGLDAEIRKVTLKIDVSYTDHSHIIGRGGNTIKTVMMESGCHIHFPDCNRSNQHEKSNMVSIAGELEKVEMARASVRELIPLVFSFDLPVLGALFMPMEEHNPFITTLKEKYNVQVFFRTKQKLNSTLVLVKGSRAEYDKVKEATEKLIVLLKAPHSEQVQIHGTIEISPHHHAIVRGKDNCNLNLIKASTGTQITFPDLHDPNIPAIKRSNVTVTGNCIHSVYLALQFIIGSLPVTFTFDLPERVASMAHIKNVNEKYDVLVTSKLRSKSSVFTFVIKGIERNMANIYEAYRVLTAYDAPEFPVQIPSSYMLSGALPFNAAMNKWEDSALSASSFSLMPSPQSLSPVMPPLSPSPSAISPPPGMHRSTASNHFLLHHAHHKHSFPEFNSHDHSYLQQPYSLWPYSFLPSAGQASSRISGGEMGRYSMSTSSLRDVPAHSSAAGSNISSPGQSPILSPRTASPTPSINLMNSDSGISCGKPSSIELDSMGLMENVKQSAIHAVKQRPRPSELRIPTPMWAGFGFSHSSPPPSFKRSADYMSKSDDGDEWRSLSGARSKSSESLPLSNIVETVGSSVIDAVTGAPYTCDLQTLLASIGLEKYYTNFRSHEATDLDIFTSLNEQDLITIGINALGSRKKLLMLIAELNSRLNRFRTTPGAERKRLRKEMWWPEP